MLLALAASGTAAIADHDRVGGVFKLGDFIGRNGAIYGYSSAMFYLPSANATIVVVGNQSSNFLTATTTIAFALGGYLFP